MRRSVVSQTTTTAVKIGRFMAMPASKPRRKLDSGPRRRREADRLIERPDSKYSYRTKGQVLLPTRKASAKVITLHPAIVH
ncbi:hypothetical protein OG948_57070 (plasmid) [Embleya sp. NBC_00888]|nr:hypothetical protein OG948_57070 [Embleya sp. NBC_00888]